MMKGNGATDPIDPLPSEAHGSTEEPSPSSQAVLEEGMALYQRAEETGVTLRFVGSLAIQLTCPKWKHLAVDLERRPSRDIDFVGYAKEQRRIEDQFVEAGYVIHPAVKYSQEYGVKRLIFLPVEQDPHVDIFLDDLIMAHTVQFSGRLGLSKPTVSLVDLLLSKLQIHEITRNDLVDLVILLAEHDIGGVNEPIDGKYFASVLGHDWGFHYSASLNLATLRTAVTEFEVLPEVVVARVCQQIDELLRLMDSAPKSSRWKIRARVGPRVRWHEIVSEVI
jgi:hypothetical protein